MNIVEENIRLWDGIFASHAWGRYPPEELVRFTARAFPAQLRRQGLRALEVGCGPGPNLWFLAREGFTLAGIDGSPTAIGRARRRLEQEGLTEAARQADLKAGNFATLPWADASFDLVIDIEAIYANPIATIRSVLAEILRVLRPGGWFFAKMFGPDMTGITSGELLEPGTTRDPAVGPLSGKGVAHAFTEGELHRELSAFSELHLDWVRRSDQDGSVCVFEWLVSARK